MTVISILQIRKSVQSGTKWLSKFVQDHLASKVSIWLQSVCY